MSPEAEGAPRQEIGLEGYLEALNRRLAEHPRARPGMRFTVASAQGFGLEVPEPQGIADHDLEVFLEVMEEVRRTHRLFWVPTQADDVPS